MSLWYNQWSKTNKNSIIDIAYLTHAMHENYDELQKKMNKGYIYLLSKNDFDYIFTGVEKAHSNI